jgi:hypothetical protein
MSKPPALKKLVLGKGGGGGGTPENVSGESNECQITGGVGGAENGYQTFLQWVSVAMLDQVERG